MIHRRSVPRVVPVSTFMGRWAYGGRLLFEVNRHGVVPREQQTVAVPLARS